MSGLRRGHPVGADQGPVQAGVRLFGRAQPLKDLGKVRGPVGDHPQGLMQIPVGRGPAHPRVAGQGGQGGARHHPPQQEHRLNPTGGRPLPRPRVMGPAVGGQPQADGAGDGLGNIQSGRIGHPRGDPLRGSAKSVGGGLMSGVVGVLARVRRGPAGTMGGA